MARWRQINRIFAFSIPKYTSETSYIGLLNGPRTNNGAPVEMKLITLMLMKLLYKLHKFIELTSIAEKRLFVSASHLLVNFK